MDRNGGILIFYGEGTEKSMAALGSAIQMAGAGKSVCLIPFLQGRNSRQEDFLGRLEPQIKCFNFARASIPFQELDPENRLEETMNLRNCFHFAKKTVATGEYELVVLDEILDLIDLQLITEDDLCDLLACKPEEAYVILTGNSLTDRVRTLADRICRISGGEEA